MIGLVTYSLKIPNIGQSAGYVKVKFRIIMAHGYSLEQLINDRGYHKKYYYIPPEWILVKNGWDEERITGWWSYCSSFSRYLEEATEGKYDTQDWYDYWILGIDSPNDRPKCPNCGTELKFVNISHGYSPMGEDSFMNFCSQECSIKYRISHPEIYQNYYEFMKNGGGAGIMYRNPDKYPEFIKHVFSGSGWARCHEHPEIYGDFGFRNPEIYKITSIEGRFTDFMNKGNEDDICYFYLAVTDDGTWKYGITSNIEVRSSYGKYVKYKILSTGTRLAIATLEKLIKYELDSHIEYIEDFSKFHGAYLKIYRELKNDHFEIT